MSALRTVAVAAACAGLVAGCKDKPKAPPNRVSSQPPPAAGDAGMSPQAERTAVASVQIRVVDPTDGPERDVFPRVLAQRLGATLTDSEWFLDDSEPPPPGVRVRPAIIELAVGYSVVPEGSSRTPAIIAVVEASVEWTDRQATIHLGMNVLAERPIAELDDAGVNQLVADHVERVVADVAAGLIAKERVRVGPEAEAIGALDTGDVDARIWALAVIRERVLADAIDAVIGRLGADREEERDAAIGALIALGDPRAVGPLTNMADFQDYALMRLVIDAVAQIGGSDAAEYLEFVATGHPDDDIVAQAKQALERMARKRKARN